jgi:hypothetical protein
MVGTLSELCLSSLCRTRLWQAIPQERAAFQMSILKSVCYGFLRRSVGNSQTQFHMASIILSVGGLLTVDEMTFFDHMSARGQATSELPFTSGFLSGTTKPFFLATDGRATISTVPEPDQTVMLAIGITILATVNWRRKRTVMRL